MFFLKRLKPPISFLIAATFIFSSIISPQLGLTQELNLPEPGKMISLSPKFVPAYVKGISIYPDDPFKFDFIIDTGNTKLNDRQFKEESDRLIKYFMAALTVPEKEDWVNLSPYEKDRIIPESLGVTEMGRDMLAQDYILKQLTSSLIYPEKEIGKEFWSKVYAQAQKKFGTTQIPVNTFNKVWIVPSQAVVWEHDNSAYVVRSHLKVMLEQDYLSLNKHLNNNIFSGSGMDQQDAKITNAVGSDVVREVVLPALEKEVNEGANFAAVRQVFNSAILAAWYKQNLEQTILGQVYVNKNKVAGVDLADKQIKQKIYERYLQAFKKGVFNYIKEESFPPLDGEGKGGVVISRKYFSGGVMDLALVTETLHGDLASLPQDDQAVIVNGSGPIGKVTVEVVGANPDTAIDRASIVKRPDIKRIAVLTGGGLATGHNFLIMAALREAEAQGPDVEILGIPNGWAGLTDPNLKSQIRRLTVEEVERSENRGGSIIKTSRTNPLKVSDDEVNKELIQLGYADLDTVPGTVRKAARLDLVKKKVETLIRALKDLGIDGLAVLGGDDTNYVTSLIHAFSPDFPVLGAPKTMDNDVFLPGGVATYGSDSYIKAATEILHNLMVSAKDQKRVMVAETFGRDAGFAAIGSGARAGATLTLIPEQMVNEDELVNTVRDFYNKNQYALIVVSEGVKFEQTKNAGGEKDAFGHQKLEGAGATVVNMLKTRLKDIKGLVVSKAGKLDYAPREAPISLEDSMIARALGQGAVKLFREDGVTGRMLYTDKNYQVKTMSFPDEKGIVTYVDDEGNERTMNISQLRGDAPDVKPEDRRKIGGRVVDVKEGGVDYNTYVAANQAIFGERSLIMRIKLGLDRIGKEMTFDIVKMSHLLDFSKELKQFSFDIQDLNPSPDKDSLVQRASEIRSSLSALVKIKAAQIASGQADFAQVSQADQAPVAKVQGGINLDANLYNMQVLRDGKGMVLPISQQPIGQFMKIKGFKPVFLNIERNINLPARLGVNLDKLPKEQLAQASSGTG